MSEINVEPLDSQRGPRASVADALAALRSAARDDAGLRPVNTRHDTVRVASLDIDLVEADTALDIIGHRLASRTSLPLGVVSINLDHVHHFAEGGRWQHTLDTAPAGDRVEWLNLADGAPIVSKLRTATGGSWPRLAGSDLIDPILDLAELHGHSVGFLGGQPATHDLLRAQLAERRPGLKVTGYWAPERADLSDRARSVALAAEIAAAQTDIVIVALGKPRQELWIAEYGALTSARVLLAFGAVVDFLAGRVERAPSWVAAHGLEWAWRLLLEPRRLAKRYLGDGPPAYVKFRRAAVAAARPLPIEDGVLPRLRSTSQHASGSFARGNEQHEATVVTVTYNSGDDIEALIESLRVETRTARLRVVVVDNGSTDGTLGILRQHSDIAVLHGSGNVGYAGGINQALRVLGETEAVLILNPDLRLGPGSVRTMLDRLWQQRAGIVVPQLLDENGATYESLRREPSNLRGLGDALFGRRFAKRPSWLAETDYDSEAYRFAHEVEWATGAALLIRGDVATALGPWDERFFLYSEETEYFRRAREHGHAIWYEPHAIATHRQGGSGTNPQLTALMSVNRIRYVESRTGSRARVFRAIVALHEALRITKPEHRAALRSVISRRSWTNLPQATPTFAAAALPADPFDASPARAKADIAPQTLEAASGAIIIPAHNEAAVIGRTLRGLGPILASSRIEVIVACNGCDDDTAAIAASFDGVTVLTVAERSKTAALNAADAAAHTWPRLYLDADIEIDASAVHAVLTALDGSGPLAARPEFRYSIDDASRIVESYYRARSRLGASTGTNDLWGAGAYAVSELGHDRFKAFAPVVADDLWVSDQFADAEKRVIASTPVIVRAPRSAQSLLGTLRRSHRGNKELGEPTGARTFRRLITSIRGPRSAFDAGVYAVFAMLSRRATRAGDPTEWTRDESTRVGGEHRV